MAECKTKTDTRINIGLSIADVIITETAERVTSIVIAKINGGNNKFQFCRFSRACALAHCFAVQPSGATGAFAMQICARALWWPSRRRGLNGTNSILSAYSGSELLRGLLWLRPSIVCLQRIRFLWNYLSDISTISKIKFAGEIVIPSLLVQ